MPFCMALVQPCFENTVKNIGENIAKNNRSVAGDLMAYYRVHARQLPWRMPPGGADLPDPYHIWMSEIMLQQTTVGAVTGYFSRFTQRWPNFAALAAADDADVMALWAGLGYYARARNLLKCARQITSEYNGILPQDEAALRRLPGIGEYTSAAILAIAFGQRAVVVDANIERVVSRLFAIDTPLPAGKAAIRAAMNRITPDANSGDFAQAMMDLGASLCSVKTPKCAVCPVQQYCAAYKSGHPDAYPVKPAKKVKLARTGTAYWIENDGRVLLLQRAGKGMLAGMRAFPDDRWAARADGNGRPPFQADWQYLEHSVQHSFTHFTLVMRIAVTKGPDLPDFGEYWPINSLDKAGLPTLFKKAAQLVQRLSPLRDLQADFGTNMERDRS